MTRTTTTAALVLAGALVSAGCEHTVFGDRSFHSNNVYGNIPKSNVYGDASFHDRDRVSGPTDVVDHRPAERAQAASDRSVTPSRSESAARTDTSSDLPRDEVARSTPRSSDADRPVDRPTARDDQPTPPADRPAATADNDRTLVRNDVKPEVAKHPGMKTSTNAPDGRDPEMVARANTARFPDDLKPLDDVPIVATVSPADHTLRVTNHTDHEILGGNLWVNEMYVTPIPNLRPGDSTVIETKQFFNRNGKMLPSLAESSKLQLQSAGKLYNVRLNPQDDASSNK
jgi:hypothetical protein